VTIDCAPVKSFRCLPALFPADLHRALENEFTSPRALFPIHSVLRTISLSCSGVLPWGCVLDSKSRSPVQDKGEAISTPARRFHDVGEPSPRKQSYGRALIVSLCANSRLSPYCTQGDCPSYRMTFISRRSKIPSNIWRDRTLVGYNLRTA